MRRLLGEPAENLASGLEEIPSWLQALQRALLFHESDSYPVSLCGPGHDANTGGFLAVFAPIIRAGLERLHEGVRNLVRDTQTYAALLQSSFHPDLLRDALDRDRLLDLLWVQVQHKPGLARLVGAEHADLVKGDIPLFTTRPGSRDLWNSAGECIADFFEQPTLTLARRRLDSLSGEDMAKQLRLIRASLTMGVGAKDMER